ncbi:MAG: hypothetical protein GY777_19340 [Candidatus Brocadiaceae bacterium]|nr:hypothetical protein [Candidatus Brocadiaceae bacterium]
MKQLRLLIFFTVLIGFGIQTQVQALTSLEWQAGIELPTTRAEGASVLSPDNAILVIGGVNPAGNKIVQKFVPGETVWTTAPDIDTQRLNPGVVSYSPQNILIIGGDGSGEASDEVLEYDYYFGDSQDVAKMNIPRYQFAFAGDSLGNSYAIGGLDENDLVLPNVEYYEPNSDSWIQIFNLPSALFAASAVGDTNGNVFVFGGEGITGIVDSVYCYSTTESAWVELPSLPVAVRNSVAVLTEGHIFVLGGVSVDGPVSTVQIFDLSTNTWTLGTELPEARYAHAALVDSLGQIVVIGGYDANGVATSTVYHSQGLNSPETPPVFTSTPVGDASLDRFYTYDVDAVGNPAPTLLLTQAPIGMDIDSETGLISWQPVEGQVGLHDITVRASNRVGDADQTFTILVASDTFPPTTPTGLQVDSVGTTTVELSWLASSDSNGVDHYSIYKTRGCGWRNNQTCYDLFEDYLVGTSVTITGLTPLTYSSYVVRAVDAAGNISGNSNKVSFQTLSEPVGFQYSYNGQTGALISFPANSLLEFNLISSANPSATYSLLSGPQGMLVDSVTGQVQWTPSAADVGIHTALFQAANSIGSTELSVEITVQSDVPQLYVQFNPNTGGARHAVAGVPFTAQVNDASNTPPTFELITSPTGMAIDATTGFITWLPSPDDAGITAVTVRSSSSAGTTDLSFEFYTHFTAAVSNIQVTDLTAFHPVASWVAPTGDGSELVTGYSIVASARYRWGRSWRTDVVNYDSPGTGTQLELSGLAAGRLYKLYINAYSATGERGLVNPIPVEFAHIPSLPSVSWTVSNGQGGSAIIAEQSIVIQLTDSNTISGPSTYSIVNAPSGLSLDSVTGEARWTPSAADIGVVSVTLRATNTVGPRDVTININVLFSGQVQGASATRVGTTITGSASWLPPTDNVLPIASYKITRHWTWSGRPRSISWTVTETSIQFSIYPTGAVSHKGITITPVDALGRLGASTPLIVYNTTTPPPPVNVAPVTNAGPDQVIALPHTTVALSGSATDDGLPNPPGAMSLSWSVVSGPGPVAFSSPNTLSTTASFSIYGTYNIRLFVSDGELSHQDDVIVTVNPEPLPVNNSPVANAGLDQDITLPNDSVTLNGVATDDGLPNPPGAMSLSWSVVSGPGVVVFGNSSAAITTASFSSAGTYILRFLVNDSELSHQDDVIVTVNPEPLPVNNSPVANAGLDQDITLPNDSVTLSGVATDDGLPDPPATLSYSWSVVSGPGTVVFGNANTASTTASFSTAGTYTLRLTVNDGELDDADDLVVTLTSDSGTPPPYDPDGPEVELQGTIQEVGTSFIVVSGTKIWYTAETVIKFEDGSGTSFQAGQPAELKGSQNADGSATAFKIQIGG